MLITAITHASARDKAYNFRGLTEAGKEECSRAAARYRDLTAGQSVPAIARVVSSPKPRCLETAILFAKELSNEALTATSVEVENGLKAGSVEGEELARFAAEAEEEHLLVSGHADLVKTLPEAARLVEDAASGGWFQSRPVLFQIRIAAGQPWEQAQIRFCEGLVDGEWQSLIVL